MLMKSDLRLDLRYWARESGKILVSWLLQSVFTVKKDNEVISLFSFINYSALISLFENNEILIYLRKCAIRKYDTSKYGKEESQIFYYISYE